MTAEAKPVLDLRTPGTIDSLVAENRLPLIVTSPSVDTRDGSSRFLVLVPNTALEPGDRWWESMGGTFSIARRGRVKLEAVDLFEVGEQMMVDIAQQIKDAQSRRSTQAI